MMVIMSGFTAVVDFIMLMLFGLEMFNLQAHL